MNYVDYFWSDYERHNQHPQEAEEEDQNNANEQQDQDLDHQAESEPSRDAVSFGCWMGRDFRT